MRSSSRRSLALVLLITLAWSALASPMRPVGGGASTPGDRPSAEQLLDATAETTIRRLPTCEVTIRTRVAEWKASASITCRKSPAPACVAARLQTRAEQLQRIRSCKFL